MALEESTSSRVTAIPSRFQISAGRVHKDGRRGQSRPVVSVENM